MYDMKRILLVDKIDSYVYWMIRSRIKSLSSPYKILESVLDPTTLILDQNSINNRKYL